MRQLVTVLSGGLQAIGLSLVVAGVLAAAVCYLPALGCVLAVRFTLSKLFPRSWAIDWEKSFALDPAWDAECPGCAAALTLGVAAKDDHGLFTQAASCAACGDFRRTGCGKVWHGWQV